MNKDPQAMIELTRLNGTTFYLNPDQILSVESTPDSTVTLLNGEKLLLRDPVDVIRERFTSYHRSIRQSG